MAFMDNINIPRSLGEGMDNLVESSPEIVFLVAGTVIGAMFLGPMGATVLGFAGVMYGYREVNGSWPWEEVM